MFFKSKTCSAHNMWHHMCILHMWLMYANGRKAQNTYFIYFLNAFKVEWVLAGQTLGKIKNFTIAASAFCMYVNYEIKNQDIVLMLKAGSPEWRRDREAVLIDSATPTYQFA